MSGGSDFGARKDRFERNLDDAGSNARPDAVRRSRAGQPAASAAGSPARPISSRTAAFRFEIDPSRRRSRHRQRRNDRQVRRLPAAAGERDRARAQGRAAPDSAGLSVRPRSRPVARSCSAAVAGPADTLGQALRIPGVTPAAVAVLGAYVGRLSSRVGRDQSLEFRDRLAPTQRAARKAPITLAMLEPLEAYFRLLAHWNAKINLTALPLEPPTDETFDRLLVEPLARREADSGATRRCLVRSRVWRRIAGDPAEDRASGAAVDDGRVEGAKRRVSARSGSQPRTGRRDGRDRAVRRPRPRSLSTPGRRRPGHRASGQDRRRALRVAAARLLQERRAAVAVQAGAFAESRIPQSACEAH